MNWPLNLYLKEIGKNESWVDALSALGYLFECLEGPLQVLVQLQNRSDISASVKVVRGAPNGDQNIPIKPILESLLNQLMGPDYQIQSIDLIELLNDLLSKEPSCSPVGHDPSVNIIWIGPHQIAVGSFVGDLYVSLDSPDLIDGPDLGAEPSVYAEDPLVDDRSQREVVEDLVEHLPWGLISVLLGDLIEEAVDHSYLSGLVVPSEKGYMRRVLDFIAKKQLDCLDWVVASIDEVAYKDIVAAGQLASYFEQLQKVVELAVDVPANGHWGAHRLDGRLFYQDFLDFLANVLEDRLLYYPPLF